MAPQHRASGSSTRAAPSKNQPKPKFKRNINPDVMKKPPSSNNEWKPKPDKVFVEKFQGGFTGLYVYHRNNDDHPAHTGYFDTMMDNHPEVKKSLSIIMTAHFQSQGDPCFEHRVVILNINGTPNKNGKSKPWPIYIHASDKNDDGLNKERRKEWGQAIAGILQDQWPHKDEAERPYHFMGDRTPADGVLRHLGDVIVRQEVLDLACILFGQENVDGIIQDDGTMQMLFREEHIRDIRKNYGESPAAVDEPPQEKGDHILSFIKKGFQED